MSDLRAILVSVQYSDLLAVTLPWNRHHFAEVCIVTSGDDYKNVLPIAKASNASVIPTNLFYEGGAVFNKWAALEHGLDLFGRKGWLCVAPWVPVQGAGIKSAARRRYNGLLVSLLTVSGRRVSLTPDHKVLTDNGWVAAKEIRQGYNLLQVKGVDPVGAPQVNHHPTQIGQEVDSLLSRLAMKKVRPVRRGMNLETDFSNSDVEVVPADRKLATHLEPLGQPVAYHLLKATDSGLACVFRGCNLHKSLVLTGNPLESSYGGGNSFMSNLDGFSRGPNYSGLAVPSYRNPCQSQMPFDGALIDAESDCDGSQSFPSLVTLDNVVSVKIIPWSGHVYDLSTESGWFTGDGIIIHNCLMDADVLWPRKVNLHTFESRGNGTPNPPGAIQIPGDPPPLPNQPWTHSCLLLGTNYDDGPPNHDWHTYAGWLAGPLRRMMPMSEWKGKPPPEETWDRYPIHRNVNEWAGFTQIFHAADPHLGPPPWHDVGYSHAGSADSFFQAKWGEPGGMQDWFPGRAQITGCKVRTPFEVLHLGDAGVNWCGRAADYLNGTRPPEADGRRAAVGKLWQERARRRAQRQDPFGGERLKSEGLPDRKR